MTELDLALPPRPSKPRFTGRTHILDKGMGPRAVADLLEVACSHIDLSKLGWGTAVVTENLEAKLAIYREFGVDVCLGGTLFELAYLQDRLDAYASYVTSLGIHHIEISDGTIDMPADEKLGLIERFAADFIVLSEVGSKDADAIVTPAKWVRSILDEIEAGAKNVILEGRESGTAGMYRPNGEIRMGLIDEISDAGITPDKLVFEAPTKASQVWFLKHVGHDLNFGNVRPEDAIPLETLRLGLRGDSLLDLHA